MLDHFHVEDHIEAEALRRQAFGRRCAIIDRHAALGGMGAGGEDVLFGSVGPGDSKAQPGHWFAEKAAAAADIQQAEALEGPQCRGRAAKMAGGFLADKGKPDRIEFVQGREFALRVPPFRGNDREFGHFRRVY